MEVLGKGSDDSYICKVSHTEIEKFMNLYYGKMGRLKVGESVDLGKGYDFMADTKDALRKTQAFIESNQEVIQAITSGILVMSREAER